MSYGFKEFAIEVLKTLNSPLSKMQIWEEGVKLGLDKKLGTQGKTPWHSIGARIYTEIKDGVNPRFKQVSKRPALFALVGQEFTEKDIDKSSKENNEVAKEENAYKERDLHPILVKYLFSSSHFKCLTKTIYHEQSKKKSKNSDKWIHPDLIGVYFPFDDYNNLTLQAIPVLKEKSYKIFTFEMKVKITLSNLREYFFQAVSNSSWANEGYLVAPEISEDDDFLSELSMLNNAFGIGVIKLNIEIPEQSEILFYSRQNANVDINMIDKLIEKNKDVKDVFEALIDSEKLSKVSNKSKFDKILDDEEYEKYLKEKKILKK